MAEIEKNHPEKSVYYADETGIDRFVYRENVRAKRGVKVYSEVCGRKFERLSVIAGKCGKKVVAPLIYNSTADSAFYEYWFERHLCPEIAGNVVVIDNASIHRKKKLHEIAARFDVTLIFQPPYSPDLNKIEKFWAWLKKKLRSVLKTFDNLFDAICYCFQVE